MEIIDRYYSLILVALAMMYYSASLFLGGSSSSSWSEKRRKKWKIPEWSIFRIIFPFYDKPGYDRECIYPNVLHHFLFFCFFFVFILLFIFDVIYFFLPNSFYVASFAITVHFLFIDFIFMFIGLSDKSNDR